MAVTRYHPVSNFIGTVVEVILILLVGHQGYGRGRAGDANGRLSTRVTARTQFPRRHATHFTVTFDGSPAASQLATYEYVRLMHRSSRGLKRMPERAGHVRPVA